MDLLTAKPCRSAFDSGARRMVSNKYDVRRSADSVAESPGL